MCQGHFIARQLPYIEINEEINNALYDNLYHISIIHVLDIDHY